MNTVQRLHAEGKTPKNEARVSYFEAIQDAHRGRSPVPKSLFNQSGNDAHQKIVATEQTPKYDDLVFIINNAGP